MLQADPGVIRDNHQIFRLFVHESQRVFHDRLINNEDKLYFHEIMSEMATKHFAEVGLDSKMMQLGYVFMHLLFCLHSEITSVCL